MGGDTLIQTSFDQNRTGSKGYSIYEGKDIERYRTFDVLELEMYNQADISFLHPRCYY